MEELRIDDAMAYDVMRISALSPLQTTYVQLDHYCFEWCGRSITTLPSEVMPSLLAKNMLVKTHENIISVPEAIKPLLET